MPRQGSSPSSRTSLKQRTLLGFFQPGSSQAAQAANAGSPEGKMTAPAKRTRSTNKDRLGATKKCRKVLLLQSSDSEQPDEDGGSESSDVGAIGFEETSVSSRAEEDDNILSPKRPHVSPRKVHKMRAVSVENSSAVEGSDGEPEVVGVPVFRKKKGRIVGRPSRKSTVIRSSDEEEPRPKRRKLVKGVRPATPEEDLLDEVDSDSKNSFGIILTS